MEDLLNINRIVYIRQAHSDNRKICTLRQILHGCFETFYSAGIQASDVNYRLHVQPILNLIITNAFNVCEL